MTQEAARYDVAISGASFAGLALACALSDALGPEFRIAVIDRAAPASVPADARAFALSAASRHLLEATGVWHAIAPEAQPVNGIDITDSSLDDATTTRPATSSSAPATLLQLVSAVRCSVTMPPAISP